MKTNDFLHFGTRDSKEICDLCVEYCTANDIDFIEPDFVDGVPDCVFEFPDRIVRMMTLVQAIRRYGFRPSSQDGKLYEESFKSRNR